MSTGLKSFLITIGIVGFATGWTALITIDGMPGWYYGIGLVFPLLMLFWACIHAMLKRHEQEMKDDG